MYSWQRFFEQTLASLQQSKAKQDYRAIQKTSGLLDDFESIEGLIEFLNDSQCGSRDEKDALLSSIISCAQSHSDLSATCRDILLIAMRPALDRVFHSLLSDVPESCDRERRLVNDIFWIFHKEIQTWDHEKRSHTSATLKLNVLRKVKRSYVVEERSAKKIAQIDHLNAHALDLLQAVPSLNTAEEATPEPSRIAEALLALHPKLKGADIHLILGRFAYNKPFSVLAQELDITVENARQRFRRAQNQLRARKKSR
jgi:hypothetical protein